MDISWFLAHSLRITYSSFLVTGSLQQRNSKASSTSDNKAPPTVTPIPTSTVQVKDEPIADDVEETKSDNGTAASDIKTEEFDLGIVKNDQNSKSGWGASFIVRMQLFGLFPPAP